MSYSAEQRGILITLAATGRRSPLARYAVAGLLGTLMHYGLLFALLGITGPVPASTTGAVAGAIVNFLLARHWVFRDRQNVRYTFPKFLVVGVTVIGVNASILSLMILSLPVLPSQVVATGCAFLAGYVLNDLWSFGERAR